MPVLRWSAWNGGNGSLGIKVPVKDREACFSRDWDRVRLRLWSHEGYREVEVNVGKASFWNDSCHELISADIRNWLADIGQDTWPNGYPPKVLIEPLGEGVFDVHGVLPAVRST